jgi:hypothetical protein
MKVVRASRKTVIVSVDSDSTLGMTPDEAIELRDLLLREFPVPLDEHERQRLAEMNVELFSRVEKILRRERIATAVLAGLIANPHRDGNYADYALDAKRFADAMIVELDRE